MTDSSTCSRKLIIEKEYYLLKLTFYNPKRIETEKQRIKNSEFYSRNMIMITTGIKLDGLGCSGGRVVIKWIYYRVRKVYEELVRGRG